MLLSYCLLTKFTGLSFPQQMGVKLLNIPWDNEVKEKPAL